MEFGREVANPDFKSDPPFITLEIRLSGEDPTASIPGYGELLPVLSEDEVGCASSVPIPDDRERSVGEVLPREVGRAVGEPLYGDTGCSFGRITEPDFADDGRESFSIDLECDSGKSISDMSAGQHTCQLVIKKKSECEFLIEELR